MTYEAALSRAIQRTNADVPTAPRRLHDGWVTCPVAFVSDWPRGKGGKRILTCEDAAARAKALTEAGRPSVVTRTKSGSFHVTAVPLSSPVHRRFVMPPDKVKLSEEAVAEVREVYRHGGTSMRDLAKRCGVGYSTIWQAIHALTWADVV